MHEEDSLQESVLTFYQVGPGDQTRVIRLGGKLLYQMCHFAGLKALFLSPFVYWVTELPVNAGPSIAFKPRSSTLEPTFP